jgi:outer membrane protein assembly factor BamA
VNRAWSVVLACVACAPAPRAVHPAVLASAPPHVPTIAERRADVCARSGLVALEGPLVASSNPVAEHGVVQSVSVRDASNREVAVDAQTLALLPRDAELDATRAREVVRRLWTSGKWDDVAVETTRGSKDDAVAVVFRVTPKRDIANVFTVAESDASALHVSQGTPYDPVAIISARTSYMNELAHEGRLDARVSVSSAFADVDHRTMDVCVSIDRGPLVVLDALVVRGSAYAVALQASFESNVPGSVLDEQLLERDLLRTAATLYDRGLLTSKVQKTIQRAGNALTVVVDVTDGPVYRYSHLDVRGELAAPRGEYMKLVTPKAGDVFDRSAMLKVMETIRALDAAKGHADSEIEPETTLDEKKHTVALVLAIKHPKR